MGDQNHPSWAMLPAGGFYEEGGGFGEEEDDDNSDVESGEYVWTGYGWGDGQLDIETELAELEHQLVLTLLKYYVLKALYLNYY